MDDAGFESLFYGRRNEIRNVVANLETFFCAGGTDFGIGRIGLGADDINGKVGIFLQVIELERRFGCLVENVASSADEGGNILAQQVFGERSWNKTNITRRNVEAFLREAQTFPLRESVVLLGIVGNSYENPASVFLARRIENRRMPERPWVGGEGVEGFRFFRRHTRGRDGYEIYNYYP